MLKENNKIKNSVLIDLFYEDESAKKNQIALYNALHEEKLPENASVRKLRIENTLYMHFQNDFSYEADEQEAYELAIHECIEKGILADYLRKKGSEVINMLKAEYDYELDIQVQREEAYEQGEEAGRQQGEAIGRQQGMQQANIDAVRNMLEFGVSKADILKKYTKAEYDAAIAETEEK